MQIVDNIIILALPILAFIAGKKISDKYHERQITQLEYQIKLYAAEKGLAYVAPPVKQQPIGHEFMEKLKENGRATQAIHQ